MVRLFALAMLMLVVGKFAGIFTLGWWAIIFYSACAVVVVYAFLLAITIGPVILAFCAAGLLWLITYLFSKSR